MTITISLDWYTVTVLLCGAVIGFAFARRDYLVEALRVSVPVVAYAVGVYGLMCFASMTPPLVMAQKILATSVNDTVASCPTLIKPKPYPDVPLKEHAVNSL